MKLDAERVCHHWKFLSEWLQWLALDHPVNSTLKMPLLFISYEVWPWHFFLIPKPVFPFHKCCCMSTFSLNAHEAAVLFNKTPAHEKQEKKKEKKKEFLNTFLSCEDAVRDVFTTAPSCLWWWALLLPSLCPTYTASLYLSNSMHVLYGRLFCFPTSIPLFPKVLLLTENVRFSLWLIPLISKVKNFFVWRNIYQYCQQAKASNPRLDCLWYYELAE